MPRIRTIKPKFWDDKKLSKVSRDARLTFIGFWTFADDLGVIISDEAWLKSKIFPYDKLEPGELNKWVDELLEYKFILPFEYNGENFFVIRTFNKHQVINKPNNEDVFIENESIKSILEQSRNNHGIITERSLIIPVSIQGGEEGRGEDNTSKEVNKKKLELEEVNNSKSSEKKIELDESVLNVYSKDFSDLKILNGKYKKVTVEGFAVWKEFVDFVYKESYSDLLIAKFVFPQDFEELWRSKKFTKDKWKSTIEKILATGVKPEHNLFFRIPQFMEYGNKRHKNDSGRVIENVSAGGFGEGRKR